jgi:AcrR family transcriptional regulator
MARASQSPKVVRIRSSASDKRIAILRAARALVADVGFRETQMTAVAEAAGVALGTLYRYFPSKAELMVEIVGLVSQREVDVAAGVAMGDGSAVERLAQAAWAFASRAVRGRKLGHALVAEPVEPEIEAARLQYRRKLARVFETIIEQGIRGDEMPVQDIQAAAACIVGSLFEGLVGPLASDTSSSVEDRYRQTISVVGFCLRGVCGRTISFEPRTNQPIGGLDSDPLQTIP